MSYEIIFIIIPLIIVTFTHSYKSSTNQLLRNQNATLLFLTLDDTFQEHIRSNYKVKNELKANGRYFLDRDLDLILEEIIRYYHYDQAISSKAQTLKVMNNQERKYRYHPLVIQKNEVFTRGKK